MYRITKKSINKNTHACTLYISNTFVERSQATGNIYNLVFQIFLPLYYQNSTQKHMYRHFQHCSGGCVTQLMGQLRNFCNCFLQTCGSKKNDIEAVITEGNMNTQDTQVQSSRLLGCVGIFKHTCYFGLCRCNGATGKRPGYS